VHEAVLPSFEVHIALKLSSPEQFGRVKARRRCLSYSNPRIEVQLFEPLIYTGSEKRRNQSHVIETSQIAPAALVHADSDISAVPGPINERLAEYPNSNTAIAFDLYNALEANKGNILGQYRRSMVSLWLEDTIRPLANLVWW
jgi:hypothetical protein